MGSNNSYGNLPFGYDTNGLQGLGLPAFANAQPPPPPPPSQHPGSALLTHQEQEAIGDFLSNFEADSHAPDQQLLNQYNTNLAQIPQPPSAPHNYIGYDSTLRSPMDWQQNAFDHFGSEYYAQRSMPASNGLFMNGALQTWHQPFSPHQAQGVQFGSDPNFMASHFTGPDNGQPLHLIDYSPIPHANSHPSEPTSPAIPGKRDYQTFRNGQHTRYPAPPEGDVRKGKSFSRHEQLPTPLSKVPSPQEVIGVDDDAEGEPDGGYAAYEEAIDDGSRIDSPTDPWPGGKIHPIRTDQTPLANRIKRKSTSISTPTRTRLRRQSSSLVGAARIPLTAEQKKANHTNSEQRRRDATAKAYAELYDLVPEMHDGGKLSTMRKLEVVVDKVKGVKQYLEEMRIRLGRDPRTGQQIASEVARLPPLPNRAGLDHLSGWR